MSTKIGMKARCAETIVQVQETFSRGGIMRRFFIAALAVMASSTLACAEDIVLRGMGSFHIGGRIAEIHGKSVPDIVRMPGAPSSKPDPNGRFQVEHTATQNFL